MRSWIYGLASIEKRYALIAYEQIEYRSLDEYYTQIDIFRDEHPAASLVYTSDGNRYIKWACRDFMRNKSLENGCILHNILQQYGHYQMKA